MAPEAWRLWLATSSRTPAPIRPVLAAPFYDISRRECTALAHRKRRSVGRTRDIFPEAGSPIDKVYPAEPVCNPSGGEGGYLPGAGKIIRSLFLRYLIYYLVRVEPFEGPGFARPSPRVLVIEP